MSAHLHLQQCDAGGSRGLSFSWFIYRDKKFYCCAKYLNPSQLENREKSALVSDITFEEISNHTYIFHSSLFFLWTMGSYIAILLENQNWLSLLFWFLGKGIAHQESFLSALANFKHLKQYDIKRDFCFIVVWWYFQIKHLKKSMK